MRLIEIDEFVKLAAATYTLVDARRADVFAEGFLKNSISISADENFISRFQDLIEGDQQVLIVADAADVPEILKKIKGAGIMQVQGFLSGGLDLTKVPDKQKDLLIAIDTEELGIDYRFDEFFLIDVRSADEFEQEHIEDSENIPLNDLKNALVDLEPADSFYVYANSSAQALTAGSLFRRYGFARVKVVADTYANIKGAGIPVVPKKKKTSAADSQND